MMSEGYLAVEKSPEYTERVRNARYKGVYRLPPYWFGAGTDQAALDDYVFGKYKDKEGLIPNFELARDLFRKFGASSQKMEIIYARALKPGSARNRVSGIYELLGFDVACGTPFWSPAADLPTDGAVEIFAQRLNQNGLYKNFDDAAEYLDAYRARWLKDETIVLKIWEVYQVK
jgi:hypothetical protein